jgi:sugar phosphate isomerase/epimerase
MRLGFLARDLNAITTAAVLGFDGVELLTSAFCRADDRRKFDPSLIEEALRLTAEHDLAITAVAYYDLAFDPPPADEVTEAYERAFKLARRLEVDVVASMSGFDPARDWDGNLELFAERFRPVCARAEARGLRLAIENWMGFWGRLPFRPMNMGGSPDTWDAWFALVSSPALGIEFDPSHLFWQGIDHIRALREYASRVYHVHAKDVELLPERRYRAGINGDVFRFRVPGYGAIDWRELISTLDELAYDGDIAIEHEDPVYDGERFTEGLLRGRQTLHPLVHVDRS